MAGSIRLGRIAGIEIDINLSWLIILALLTVSLALDWFPFAAPRLGATTYWILGLIAAVLLFVSVLAHEFAHSLYAKAHGIPVKSITLFIFGGVSNIQNEPQTPGVEFWHGARRAASEPSARRRLLAGRAGLRRGAGALRALRVPGGRQSPAWRLQSDSRLPAGWRPCAARDALEDHREPAHWLPAGPCVSASSSRFS